MQGLKEVSDKKIQENNRPEGNWKEFHFQGEIEKEFGRIPAQVNPQPALHIEGRAWLLYSAVVSLTEMGLFGRADMIAIFPQQTAYLVFFL